MKWVYSYERDIKLFYLNRKKFKIKQFTQKNEINKINKKCLVISKSKSA